ncbi:YwdI family protein [Ureibacillus sp. NPDC094379]
MISYETLLSEIEKHLTSAKNTLHEQQLREQLIAIRALCDVALANRIEIQVNQKVFEHQVSQPVVLENKNTSLSSTKLQENDANGDSIFDF